MKKTKGLVAVTIGLGLALASDGQIKVQALRQACIQRCSTMDFVDPDLQRQEIVSLERETARAIQLNNGAFFRRVYSDDFTGTLSHGQLVDKKQWLAQIEPSSVQYESFIASDIKVQIYQDMAIATCLWSSRFSLKGQRVGHQMRVIHVYLNGASGWHVVSGQITGLPPDVPQPL
jgi:uncharacterized protein DUF4440